MGDRRIADRREKEEGVVKIKTNRLIVYIIIAVILAISILSNIILGILYFDYKKNYELLIGDSDDYGFSDEEVETDATENYCNLLITGDKEQIKPGETITYEIKVENIETGLGITMFEALLDYDSDSFECEVITDENSGWIKSSLDNNYLTMTRENLIPSEEDQTIAKISLKAKEGTTIGQYTLELNELTFTTDDDDIFSLPDESVIIDVI